MKNDICLDAGIISIFFSNDISDEVKYLFNNIQSGKNNCYVLKPILIESYYHLCKLKGIDFAQLTLKSFISKYKINFLDISENLIYSAGKLKCQNRKKLSYNDALSISFCLNNNCTFHTTEKNLKKGRPHNLNKLKIKKYYF